MKAFKESFKNETASIFAQDRSNLPGEAKDTGSICPHLKLTWKTVCSSFQANNARGFLSHFLLLKIAPPGVALKKKKTEKK